MSVTTSQEHSYLKVLFDFQYKTAEGREIIIKKNERLYLLQKTNADWWQVVRNFEQRSFYVPATYVREVSKTSGSSTRKNSEEERDTIFEPPQDPSYKSMPKESSSAMRNVKKWLAGAIDNKPEPPKSLYDSEAYQKTDSAEGGSKGRLKVGSVDARTKSLERDRRSGHFSDREEDLVNGSPRSRDSGEINDNPGKTTNRFGTSPKGSGIQFRIEASLQEPFRRELESSLDRRNLSGKLGTRIRTRSTNSEGSHVDSDAGETREAVDKIEMDNLLTNERRGNLSIHEELPRDSRDSGGASRNSRSLDAGDNKFSIRTEGSTSPKPVYGRQMTIAGGGSTVYQEKKMSDVATGDHKILNDKRRTWAVEELMSELTQMCKERVTSKKPAFQLKSTEVKTSFDPIEKLTREIHEMNRMRSEAGVTTESQAFSANPSTPINVCKISINSSNSAGTARADAQSTSQDSIARKDQTEVNSHKNIDDATSSSSSSSGTSRLRDSRVSASFGQHEADPATASSPKILKSPKSPKILDEYNEANILNDCNSLEGISRNAEQSLSPDKQSFYHKLSSPGHACAVNTRPEEPCYSNVKVSADRVKARPKLRIKTGEPSVELRLTPSLEKLASEIQFLPARRTSQTSVKEASMFGSANEGDFDKTYEETSKSDDSLERHEYRGSSGSLERRIEYRGSFKSKRETRYGERERRENDGSDETGGSKKSGLRKKSSTLNCATIPDCYRRFRKQDFQIDRFETVLENSVSHKRRSRSLSDLESLEVKFSEIKQVDEETPKVARIIKPVPLPRTKIPAVKSRESPSPSQSNVETTTTTTTTSLENRKTTRSNVERLPPRTIPEQRKPNRERNDDTRPDNLSRGNRYDLPSFLSLEKHRNDSDHRHNVNIESSTAVGFKSLLCASDSGSDNCLQSKELLSNSTDNFNDHGSLRSARKSCSSVNFNDRSKTTRESLSDDQILSSNASSEALHSESEITATLDVSSQPSPVNPRTGQDTFECAIDLPPGWKQKYDSDIGQICFLNEQGDKWFSSNDAEGKIYFFEENSNESSWVLPPVESGKSHSISADGKNEKFDLNSSTSEKPEVGGIRSSIVANQSIVSLELPTKKAAPSGGDWPHLCDGNNMLVLKEGIINRTKITENGKKLRKNWSTSYAVLTELFLLFFKDAKTFTMMKTGQTSMAKPDISVDLNGALVEPGERASSRKNVYMISTVLGLQVLVQSDNTAVATEWFQEIHSAIRKLPSGFKSQGKPLSIAAEIRKTSGGKQPTEINVHEDTKKFTKIARSRSMKMKRLDDSLEDLSGSAAERQTKIKAKLRRFFQRRPAVELLVKNGIYKDEPAFGSYLSDVCPTESPRVPLFVKTCIEVLESDEENMKTDGLYRASGNLSQIQKIRLQVDQYKLDVLAQEEDVHVLAGALKLFFRELKEPLIPSSFFKEAVNASMLKKSSAKIQCFREIVKALPSPNYDTLQYLLKHLLRVTSYQEFNRMHIPNLAIVFGPTLMWPAEESANMALDFMQQNLVIECLLSEYNKIFK